LHFAFGVNVKAIRATAGCIKILCASLVLSLQALAEVEGNAILALEPLEGMVVVRTAAGKLEVITIGDAFPDSEVVVKQVLADKVVAEEVVGDETKIAQQVWIYKAEGAGASSRVERLLLSLPQNGTPAPGRIQLDTRSVAPDPQGEIQ